MTTADLIPGLEKPKTLRVIFILNALKILLTFGFFVAFKFFGFALQELQGDSAASLMLYTMFGYMAAFAVMVASIIKRNIMGLRAAIAVDFLISIPARAPIGFAVAIISIILTFTPPVKAYFAFRES